MTARPIIFTDMDATLLDHANYSFEPARPALNAIRRHGIPLVLASSKTREEMLVWQDRLDLDAPFICENGAAICERGPGDSSGVNVTALACDRAAVLDTLHRLRDEQGFRFRGFADCDLKELVALTGLSAADARLAASREYSEPVQWQDTDQRRDAFIRALEAEALQALQGGRFLTVSGPCDKADALQVLRDKMAGTGPVVTIALGDSPNDLEMLAAADIAVIIASANAGRMQVSGPREVIRTTRPGPAGWQEAMARILPTLGYDFED